MHCGKDTIDMTMRMQKSSNHGTTDNDDDDKTMGEKCRPRTQTLSKLEYECQSKKQQGSNLKTLVSRHDT